jgi:hypothetical protein
MHLLGALGESGFWAKHQLTEAVLQLQSMQLALCAAEAAAAAEMTAAAAAGGRAAVPAAAGAAGAQAHGPALWVSEFSFLHALREVALGRCVRRRASLSLSVN